MKLSEETKQAIKKEYSEFETQMYAGKSKAERDELAQFFTPPEISIKLIEELSDLSGNILDPACGSGNLLAAALIAGADPTMIFGNDYDAQMVELARARLQKINPAVKDWQIHQGNALHEFALKEFREDYDELYFDGVKADYAKNRKLENEAYNAYLDSKAFKKNCKAEHESYCEIFDKEDTKNLTEQFGGYCINWG